MKFFLLISVFVTGCISISSAQLKISGIVRNEDSLAVSGADILIHNITSENKPLVQFTRTNDQGFYTMIIENIQPEYLITVRATTFQTIQKKFKVQPKDSEIRQNFVLHSSVSYLDTVKVDLKVSISKTGDTITFNPDAFVLKSEVHIEDMLKRLPGMEVKENGEIYFNGHRISNVLIDGDDLFGENYKQLTQNAAPKIVDRVQVIKNYKKDQLLREFDLSGDQVINLKIKDQYKNYLFGNISAGYGNKKNHLGDIFLIKLGSQKKIQAGVNYNTTGTHYNPENQFYLNSISRSDDPFFKYSLATPLLSVSRYNYPNIPDYYQNKNNSITTHFNSLFKKNKWETLINASFSKDKESENQRLNRVYQDSTHLFSKDTGTMTDSRQEYSITSSRNARNESIYINASLQNAHRNYLLDTRSTQALESQQKLNGDNTNYQFNFNYNKRIGNGVLWSNTVGYFKQNLDEDLNTNPDFLFWLYPEDLSMYKLFSNAEIKLRYLNFKSSIFTNRGRMSHMFTGVFSSEKRTILSILKAEKDAGVATYFTNNDNYWISHFSLKYTGTYQVSPQNKITVNLSNELQVLTYSASNHWKKTVFYYDYSIGVSRKNRNSSISLNAGIKKQPQNQNLLFSNSIQPAFHRLLSGHIDSFGTKSSYLQGNYSLFSLKLGWIAFLSINISRNENKYISATETKGIATTNSSVYFPNSTNQMFILFNTQKTLGAWPFSMNSNIFYNIQSDYNSFNGRINSSTLSFLNTTIGVKSQFESFINFDYQFLWTNARNKIKIYRSSPGSSNSILNKINIFLTPIHLFNSTITFNNLVSNNGSFHGTFLDLKLNRKLLKDRFIIEFNLRNLFDKKYISNTVIGTYYTQENRTEIRGREFFFTIRYEFR